MHARPVDPRDDRWEESSPVYRTCFWEPVRPEQTDSGWRSDERQLKDAADIDEVLSWAHAKATGRGFVLYVEVTRSAPDGCGLIRLLETDPTDPSL